MNRIFKNLAIYLLIVLIAVSVLRMTNTPPVQEVVFEDFTEFYEAVEKGKIKNVDIISRELYQELSGTTTDGKEFSLDGPKDYDQLIDILVANKVKYRQLPTPPQPWWISVLSTLLPVLLLVGVFFFLMQQTQGGGGRVMQFGKSRAKLHTDEKTRVTFADVAGADEVKRN